MQGSQPGWTKYPYFTLLSIIIYHAFLFDYLIIQTDSQSLYPAIAALIRQAVQLLHSSNLIGWLLSERAFNAIKEFFQHWFNLL